VTQTEKARATAGRIADVAARLFLNDGYDATTIAAVAAGADVAAGTVLLHFGSKSELATAAFANEIRALVQRATREVPGTSTTVDLRAFIGVLYRWYDDHGTVAPTLLRHALFSSGPWAIHYRDTVGQTVTVIGTILTRHLVVDPDELELLGQGVLAEYLLVLMQGMAGTFDSVDTQIEHFLALADTRLRHYRAD